MKAMSDLQLGDRVETGMGICQPSLYYQAKPIADQEGPEAKIPDPQIWTPSMNKTDHSGFETQRRCH